jgi:putative membrane protein
VPIPCLVDRRPERPIPLRDLSSTVRAVAMLALITVGLQISYPLLHGTVRMRMTVFIVVVSALTCVAHAVVSRGPVRAFAGVLATAGLGFCLELLGVNTGVPFGDYSYGSGLGPRVLGVPVVVALAWTMLAWPAAIAARRLVRGRAARILVGAWALASADLFLDPQLVAAGAWQWRHPSPHLPGVPTVPLSNLLGWLLAGLLVSAAVQTMAGRPRSDGDDGVMVTVYLWLWAGWLVALVGFLHLPAAAAWGGVGMGLVALPLAFVTARRVRAALVPAPHATPRAGAPRPHHTPTATHPRTPEPATHSR